MQYQHRQPAKTILSIVLPLTLILAVVFREFGLAVVVMVVTPLLLVAWLFWSMTIEVDDMQLRWFFGPGFWKKSLSLSQLHSASAVTNRWWYGWGIRLTPSGWLYNVSGLSAVELHLVDGTRIRLGTDQPHTLAEVLQRTQPEQDKASS
ncbi:hypothetical protein [Lacimicrobium sp. SS2-24]|uniref:hypothetical protein n=1 Tax=Lacimicrobium sp. SS2-24 TaxID=2005569 RepID=UPI000B4BF8DF|nr:hypothetical protein [Lacimicrobium sp. SS2-24]